jgi:hypothetical protein
LDIEMDHTLFLQLRAVLNRYYLPAPAPPAVGYLRGSATPGIWRAKIAERNEQLMLLGNAEPTAADWANAGVEHRTGETQMITLPMLNGFVLTYGGFMAGRPWAAICDENEDSVNIGFPNALQSFQEAIARSAD